MEKQKIFAILAIVILMLISAVVWGAGVFMWVLYLAAFGILLISPFVLVNEIALDYRKKQHTLKYFLKKYTIHVITVILVYLSFIFEILKSANPCVSYFSGLRYEIIVIAIPIIYLIIMLNFFLKKKSLLNFFLMIIVPVVLFFVVQVPYFLTPTHSHPLMCHNSHIALVVEIPN